MHLQFGSALGASLLILGLAGASPVQQHPLNSDPKPSSHNAKVPLLPHHTSHPSPSDLISLLTHPTYSSDPIRLLKDLDPSNAVFYDEKRFVKVFDEEGEGQEGRWMTEGEKVLLKREGRGFADITGRGKGIDRAEAMSYFKSKSWPNLTHQSLVRSVFPHMTTHSMQDALTKLTSFYNRYWRSETGRESSEWLYKELLKIVLDAPPKTLISLEVVPHNYPQSSLIARFSPSPPTLPPSFPRQTPNNSFPLPPFNPPTIVLGAHQDSANYLFPLLPAPGADDDGSGTITILEAFRALVERGFRPRDKVVEFHWYAAEEAGLLGSLDVVDLMVGRNVTVDAMLEFDMTAYVKENFTPKINIVSTQADPKLSEWVLHLAEEYCDEEVQYSKFPPQAGSDYMSFSRAGFSAAFATEADLMANDGTYNPFAHTVADRIDLPKGEFSFDHMMEFSKLAVGFVVEQAGWDRD